MGLPNIEGFALDDRVLPTTLFDGLCSAQTARAIIDCHLESRVNLFSDAKLPGVDFGLLDFFELLRDRRWHNDEEIKFYANGREGPSGDLWSQAIRANGSLGLDTILHLKAAKASIYVKRLELMHQGLRKLAAGLAETGYFSATLSAMYSPAGALSTPNHIDTCDVLAVQLHGRKCWTVDSRARTPHALPRQSEARPDSFDFIEPTEYETNVGDALFIPRGFLHNAMANTQDSLHLVIGMLPLTWLDVVSAMVQDLCDSDAEFRSSVLARGNASGDGASADSAASWFAMMSDPDALREATRKAMRRRAKAHMMNSFGQLFAKGPQDLL